MIRVNNNKTINKLRIVGTIIYKYKQTKTKIEKFAKIPLKSHQRFVFLNVYSFKSYVCKIH